MANRRIGMGGPQRGNRPFSQHQPFQGNNVNPWQGQSHTNSLNPNLLGQLTNPQQLALALTNLLQPHQQQVNNPPSLLSLNTTPAFSHPDRDSFNRFNRGGRSDFRRGEPYNKSHQNRNGGIWRSADNKGPSNRNRNFTHKERRRSPVRPRNSSNENRRGSNKVNDSLENWDQKKDINDVRKEAAPSATSTPNTTINEVDNDQTEIPPEDGRDEENVEETKRGWKDEKNVTDEKKDTDESFDDKVEEKKDDVKQTEGKFHGVLPTFLHCFVCNKDMWDGESFEKHIKGRAHKQMLQSLEESFHITVNILRENMRLAEEKKVIELNRMHRLSKNKYRKFQEPESLCNMCDLKFLGKIIAHRKTKGHQRLKRFLHPNCNICSKEFPSRMDWVDHKLTPEHLRKLSEHIKNRNGGEDGFVMEDESEIDLEPLLEEEMEVDNPILELDDDLGGMQNRLPAYRKHRPLGTKQLKSFEGFMCDICNRSFHKETLAQAHLKTQRHYYAFIEAVKLKFKKQNEENDRQERKRKRTEEVESSNQAADEDEERLLNEEDEMYDPEEACKEDEDEALYATDQTEEIQEDTSNVKEEEEIEKMDEVTVKTELEETDDKEQQLTNPVVKMEKLENLGEQKTTRPRRNLAKAPAGPKSKKLATPSIPLLTDEGQQKITNLSTFRIPRLGAVKNGAGPKCSKKESTP